jgi:hypothetical protein
MKRIIMMLTVALIMAAMMMVSAASAFAQAPPLYPPGLVGTPFHGQDTQECRSMAQEEHNLSPHQASFACTPANEASSPY